jgi:uncharacterized damage-inducible protein DinB
VDADYFRMLFDYNYWAHHRIWDCVMQVSDEQFTRDTGYSWRSIQGQVVHTMSAEWVWFSRIQGTSPTSMLRNEDYPNRAAVRTKWDEIETVVRSFLQTLQDAELEQVIEYKNTSGQIFTQKMYEILAHVANHSTDHRAQALAMLYQLGAPTVEQDMIAYLRD